MIRYIVTRNGVSSRHFGEDEVHDALAYFHAELAKAASSDDDVTVTLTAESLFM